MNCQWKQSKQQTTSVDLMLFTGQMFQLAEIHQASGTCDCFGCSQAPTQPKPYITARSQHRLPCFAITGKAASSLSARTAMAPARRQDQSGPPDIPVRASSAAQQVSAVLMLQTIPIMGRCALGFCQGAEKDPCFTGRIMNPMGEAFTAKVIH